MGNFSPHPRTASFLSVVCGAPGKGGSGWLLRPSHSGLERPPDIESFQMSGHPSSSSRGFSLEVHPCQGHCDGARAPSRGPQGPVLPQRPWELTQDSECSGVAKGERGRHQQGDAVEFIFTKNMPKPRRTGTEIKEKSHPQPPHRRKSPDTFFPFPWVSVGRHDFIPFQISFTKVNFAGNKKHPL